MTKLKLLSKQSGLSRLLDARSGNAPPVPANHKTRPIDAYSLEDT